jgi:hypothetical protein
MSDISVLQAPGPAPVTTAKPAVGASAEAPTSSVPGPAAPGSGATEAAAPVEQKLQYSSPRLEIDPLLNQVILQYRDGQTGVAEFQVPSKAQLQLYQNTADQVSATPGGSTKNDLSS